MENSIESVFNSRQSILYIDSSAPGIRRIKKGKGFIYINPDGSYCKDDLTLRRIRRLVIPPAWTNVWICPKDSGHLQATGIDSKGRKQYRYHPAWAEDRKLCRFNKLVEFGRLLPEIRSQVEKDLALQGMPKRKVLALLVMLLEKTCIRVGNDCYQKLYQSYGLTTLRDRHVSFEGNKVIFKFKGKKGVYHQITCTESRLIKLIKKCRDIPGQELFQYIDNNGDHHCINSEDVNQYLQEITRKDFTAKDFRTWVGTSYTLRMLLQQETYITKKQCKSQMVKAIEAVSKVLGNTASVCKKHYIHPLILKIYEDGSFFKAVRSKALRYIHERLHPEEHLLINILSSKKYNH